MKKILLFMVMLIPFNIFAYSEQVILGGENVGVEVNTKGVIVVGFYKVDNKYIGSENLSVGDIILEVNGVSVNSISEMSKVIDDNIINGKVDVLVRRNNKDINTSIKLVKEGNIYKTGLYIKEKITGIGTVTYIDPSSKITGILGHELASNDSNNKIEVRSGTIYESSVDGIDRSVNGKVGSKSARIDYSKKIGDITKNSSVGLFGVSKNINGKLIDVGNFDDIKVGEALIYTTIDGSNVKPYKIRIDNTDKKSILTNKSISFTVIDKELLSKSGGIVQGMSGSPIVQDNKLIGSVTHVVVNDVVKGYGVFIRTMLEEGEE